VQRRSISTLHSGSAACELPAVLRFAGLFDVGSDTRSGVNDNDYKVPFRFTGTIDKLTFRLEPPKPSAGDHTAIEQGMARARDPPDPRSQATPPGSAAWRTAQRAAFRCARRLGMAFGAAPLHFVALCAVPSFLNDDPARHALPARNRRKSE